KFLGNNNDLAMALVIMLPFAYFLLVRTTSWLMKLLLAGTIVLFGVGIMSTLSRGGLIGLVTVAVIMAVRSRRRGTALAVFATLAVAYVALAPGAFWDRMGTIADYSEDDSARSRFYTWRAGAEMALRNPLLGVGAGNFVTAYRIRYHANRPENTTGILTAHSVYFEVLGELGFTGLGLFLALIVANFRTCARLRRRAAGAGGERDVVTTAAAACEAGLGGFLASAAFISAFYYPHFWYLTALVVIADRLGQEAVAEAPAPVAAARVALAARGAFRTT
ncbi:MAG TPA: O-antigen ligase family protein, partial [Methylomirabilota bacterium]|nr:O-antigen ligase family protein [Methylomirabilota bacterium]